MFISIRLKNVLIALSVLLFLAAGTSAASVFLNDVEPKTALPVLMYHHILKDTSFHGAYVISPDEFEKDLIFLKENGYSAITVKDLTAFVQNDVPLPEKPVMLTFDDGYLSSLEYALPLLLKYEMKAVISIIAKETELYSENTDRHVSYAHLTWEDLKQMEQSGAFEVQNHTYNMHKNKKGERCGTKRVNGESIEQYSTELKNDVGLAQKLLKENCNISPSCFTYPFGMVSDESLRIIKDMGFSASLSCEEGVNFITKNPESLYLLKRFNRAHNRSAQKIFEKLN